MLPRGSSRSSVVDDPRLHAGDGDPDGTRLLRHVETAEGGDGRRLGEAVPLHDLGAEPLFEDGDELRGHRRAAGDAELQGIGPVFLGARMEQHAEEEPRDGGDIGHLFLFDGGEDPVEGEALHQDDPGADPERRQHVRDRAEGVEEGDDGQTDVSVIHVADRPQEDRLGQEVVMGEDGAEGLSRESRGVDHDGGVVARQFRYLLREGALGDDLPEGGCIVRAVGRDDVAAEREFVLYLLEALRQRSLRDQAPGVAVAQEMRQFVRRGLDIEGYGDAADLLDRRNRR